MIFGREVTEVSVSILPLLAVLIPIVGAFAAWFAGPRSERLRDALAVGASALAFATVLAMFPSVMLRHVPISFELSKVFFAIGLRFAVDPMSWIFAFFTSFVWLAATVYSTAYMDHEQKRDRYYLFLLISLAANLGVLLAADLFSLFVFFEALSIFSYPLVIHSETEQALKAGTKYMLMNILGGATLLSGILLYLYYSHGVAIAPALATLSGMGDLKFLVPVLLIAGFGVKAGYVPLHIWLPDAHPVAPTPASALLSGIMIKAGAYGILRTVAVIFRPPILIEAAEKVSGATAALWESTSILGYGIIWLGIMTMLVAAIMALQQTNAKRLLAYSSVSQMGYIVMGIGAGTFLANNGSLGLGGAVFHILNHAMFKSTFFLVIGAVYFMTHELDMNKLGGLYRRMPVVAVAGMIAAGGIMGVPLLNGFASKTLLYESMVEAGREGHLPGLEAAKWLYLLTSSLTTAYILKFMISVFFGKLPAKLKKVEAPPLAINLGFGVLAAMILFIGLAPNLVLTRIIEPVVAYWGFHTAEFAELNFFTGAGLFEAFAVIAVGVGVFFAGNATGAFALAFPAWFSIDWWYQLVGRQVYVLSGALYWANNTLESGIAKVAPWIMRRKPALDTVNALLSRFLFAFLVDMWLAKPVTPSVRDRKIEEDLLASGKKVSHKTWASLGELGSKTSVLVGKIDVSVIDKSITMFAVLGEKLSELAGNFFDPRIVDGFINGIGWVTGKVGRILRPTQTGDVQSYGLVMLLGVVFIVVLFALVIYQVISLPF